VQTKGGAEGAKFYFCAMVIVAASSYLSSTLSQILDALWKTECWKYNLKGKIEEIV